MDGETGGGSKAPKSCRALKTVLQGGEMDVKKLKKLLLFACNRAVE